MRGHDFELMEAIGQMFLGFLAMTVLKSCFELGGLSKDLFRFFLPLLFCLMWGAFFFLFIERHYHEKTGRWSRYILAIVSCAIVVVCSLILIGYVIILTAIWLWRFL
jgi:fatty acid desaturase